jgi:hypothetical protein
VLFSLLDWYYQVKGKGQADGLKYIPAVYDVFTSPIKETVGLQPCKNCGLRSADLADRNPGATECPEHIQTC